MMLAVVLLTACLKLVLGESFYQTCFERTNARRSETKFPLLEANAFLQMETQEYVNIIASGAVAVLKHEFEKPSLYYVPPEQMDEPKKNPYANPSEDIQMGTVNSNGLYPKSVRKPPSQKMKQNYEPRAKFNLNQEQPFTHLSRVYAKSDVAKKFSSGQQTFDKMMEAPSIYFTNPDDLTDTLKKSKLLGCAIAKNIKGGAFVLMNYQF